MVEKYREKPAKDTLNIDDAIQHLDDILSNHDWTCAACKQEHEQLRTWLIELKSFRAQKEEESRASTCKPHRTCSICTKTDGLTYTSSPPMVRCTMDGKFHAPDSECTLNLDAGVTNADRIRAMSDEELAKWLCQFGTEAFAAGVLKYGAPIMNEQERLDWLQQPAEEANP